jgi:hypothetical protein
MATILVEGGAGVGIEVWAGSGGVGLAVGSKTIGVAAWVDIGVFSESRKRLLTFRRSQEVACQSQGYKKGHE